MLTVVQGWSIVFWILGGCWIVLLLTTNNVWRVVLFFYVLIGIGQCFTMMGKALVGYIADVGEDEDEEVPRYGAVEESA